ncbi:rhodanese-like domain-containing protein [Galbibacter sp. BG1]|uniref:rhodanese-like domain-containing protein n=1 Tax=Galbibacter sp. BG1 TaxID=1170699 RepID=UPI0015C0AA51|nr:rhodanese-like domain-containing protein [Galbibacter sp. BG1]QLE00468.1 rhodanese-like domain-containing protein [Galbibacter sp. BG1]
MNVKSFIFFLLTISFQQMTAQVKQMEIANFQGAHTADVVLIDVRTPEEFEGGHLKQAKNIDYRAPGFVKAVSKIDASKKIYLYCKAGGRSAKASKVLDSLGYTNVTNLDGGFDAWSESGGEVVKNKR